jgi:FixJ family two-component response regulator
MNRLEERKILSAYYANTPNKELAQMLGISLSLVGKRAFLLGLKKDPKYLSDTNRKCAQFRRNVKCNG